MERNHLEFDEVRVWSVPLDVEENLYRDCEGLLNREEIARADRFVTPTLRRRFIVCRGRLRQLLAATTDTHPQAIEFRYGQWGKPELNGAGGEQVCFNVSHSGDWALVAIGPTPVGIDLELLNRKINYRGISSQVLSPQERKVWDAMPGSARDLAILQLWICKEALLKALGLGIAEGLQKISLPLPIPEAMSFSPSQLDPSLQLHLDDDGTCRMTSWIDPDSWRVRLLQIDGVPDSHGALTTMRQIQNVSVKSLAST